MIHKQRSEDNLLESVLSLYFCTGSGAHLRLASFYLLSHLAVHRFSLKLIKLINFEQRPHCVSQACIKLGGHHLSLPLEGRDYRCATHLPVSAL